METIPIGNKEWTLVKEMPIAEKIGNRPHLLDRCNRAGIVSWVTVRRKSGQKVYVAYKWSNGVYGWQ